jgi:hypothetical protein
MRHHHAFSTLEPSLRVQLGFQVDPFARSRPSMSLASPFHVRKKRSTVECEIRAVLMRRSRLGRVRNGAKFEEGFDGHSKLRSFMIYTN